MSCSFVSRTARPATPPLMLRDVAPSLWVLVILLLVPAAPSAQEGTAILSGRVLDVTNGSPIAFASVVVEHAESGARLSSALAGEDGLFRVQGLAPAVYRIHISFPGFYPLQACSRFRHPALRHPRREDLGGDR